jgi:hypothetical protein
VIHIAKNTGPPARPWVSDARAVRYQVCSLQFGNVLLSSTSGLAAEPCLSRGARATRWNPYRGCIQRFLVPGIVSFLLRRVFP